ncbi:pyocin knob domain-containing protein [Terribacillus sp. JSM ZJ617]|uniref:pyocin knob domain-containing protein n=1 Tax=Terribacillus sp. JSM ZJ617 TaxID=3342119 RepID=UPI0035A97F1C
MADYTQQALQGTPLPSEFNRDYRELLNAYLKLWQDGKISLDLLHKRVMELADESNKLANQALDNSGTAIETSESAEATANWIKSQFNAIVGKATDGPASLQLKFGYDNKEYASPQARFLAEWELIAKKNQAQMFKVTNDLGYAISIPTGTDLNNFFEGGFYKSNNAVNAPTSGWYFYEIIRQGEKECLQIATNFGTKKRYIRYSNNLGVFNSWDDTAYRKDVQQMLDDQVKSYGLGSNPTNTVTNGTDLNTLTDSGFYRLNGETFLNQPTNVAFCQMLVMRGGGDTVTQIIVRYYGQDVWVRSGNPLNANSGKWNEWWRLASVTNDIQNFGLGVAAASGVDWNTLTKTGFYAGSINGPSSSVYIGMHVQHGSAYAYQISGRNGNQYFRTNENGVWSAWEAIAKQSDIQALKDIGIGDVRSKGSSDLNNINKSGWYSYTTSSLNIPSTTTGAGVVQHIAYDANSHAQIAYSVSMRVQWMRTKLINQEWTPWLQTAGSAANANWETLTPRGGSAVYDTANPPQVLRLGDLVMLRGALKGITGRSFLALTLPGHARPQKDTAAQTNISIGANFVARYARWNIAPNGDITMLYTSDNSFDATWWSLDGMWFTVTSS